MPLYVTPADLERALFDCLNENAKTADLDDALRAATMLDPLACKFALMDCLRARRSNTRVNPTGQDR